MLRIIRRHRWLRSRRIGCLLAVLVIAALWMLGQVVNGVTALFSDHPAPVAGSPFNPVAPAQRAGSGSPTIDRIARRGKLIVAIHESPGLVRRSPGVGGYTGFDIALLDLIARNVGVDPARTTFKPLPSGTREAALNRGEADLALGGYEITPQRRAEVGMAGPYLVRSLRLAVPAASSVTGLGSLGPGEICTPAESPAATVLADRGLKPQTRPTLAACADLLRGPVRAMVGDQTALEGVLSQRPGTLRVVGEPVGSTEYGIGLPPGDPVLHDRITAVLRLAIEDGTWARLYAQYLGTPVPSSPALR